MPAGVPATGGTAGRPSLPPEWHRLRVYGGGLAGLLVVICFVIVGVQVARGREAAAIAVQPLSPGRGAEIKVQVAGAVSQPGVYRLALGDRVEDAIRAAGGPTADADTSRLNLAQRVRDEQRLDIPFVPQTAHVDQANRPAGDAAAAAGPAEAAGAGTQPDAPGAPAPPSNAIAPRTEAEPTRPANPPPAPQPANTARPDPTPRATSTSRPEPTARPTAFSGGKVNVNTATAAQLEQLPGLGEVSVQRILAYRQANGRISSLEQLRQAGISEALLRRAADHLTFD